MNAYVHMNAAEYIIVKLRGRELIRFSDFHLTHWQAIGLSKKQASPSSDNVMNSVQSATEQQEHIGSFKRRLRRRRDGDVIDTDTDTDLDVDGAQLGSVAYIEQAAGFGLTLIDLVLLQKEYVKQFYFEKRVGSGGQQQLAGAWCLRLVNASSNFG